MRNKINFKLGECPICESKLLDDNKYGWSTCPNECFHYILDGHTGNADVVIFEENIFYDVDLFGDGESGFSDTELELIEKINYWKENNRYLTRILVGK